MDYDKEERAENQRVGIQVVQGFVQKRRTGESTKQEQASKWSSKETREYLIKLESTQQRAKSWQ
jgi:hypothetical protein